MSTLFKGTVFEVTEVKRVKNAKEAFSAMVRRMSTPCLEALAKAAQNNDQRLTQRITLVADQVPALACPVAFAIWQGEKLSSSAMVMTRFHEICDAADLTLKPHGRDVTDFYVWYDESPRHIALALVAACCVIELNRRGSKR